MLSFEFQFQFQFQIQIRIQFSVLILQTLPLPLTLPVTCLTSLLIPTFLSLCGTKCCSITTGTCVLRSPLARFTLLRATIPNHKLLYASLSYNNRIRFKLNPGSNQRHSPTRRNNKWRSYNL